MGTDAPLVLRLDHQPTPVPVVSTLQGGPVVGHQTSLRPSGVAVAVPPPVVAPPPVAAPETLQSTLARFVFLGYLKKDNRKTIFLSKDKEIILVRKGDKFAGRYEAKAITDQALTIVAADTGEEIIIPLLENQPLFAAGK